MPDNPPSASVSSWFVLADHSLLSLSGRDALAFAQSQFMNDVAALADDEWHWNGWLTPKGRVIALFALLRITADTVWLVLPDADAETLAASLRRFVFRSKVEISVRDDLRAIGRLEASERASGRHWAGTAEPSAERIELDLSGAGGGRALRIVPATTALAEDAAALAAWKYLDLAHGWPRLDDGQREQWTPQQLSLERLGAYSVKKGCYPGQEIVARTHFLGQAKRGLALLRTPTPLASGAALEHQGHSLGTVVTSTNDLALAVVALETRPSDEDPQNDESPATGGASWVFAPMFDGLKR
jgi:tRNA-modifying protein YgfZ